MAPQPKKRMAKARSKTRKATLKLSMPALTTCPKCQSLRFPHRACPNCGFYRDYAAKKDTPAPKSV